MDCDESDICEIRDDDTVSVAGSISGKSKRKESVPLNTTVMTMADLVRWNPSDQDKFKLKELEEEIDPDEAAPIKCDSEQPQNLAPKVTIGPDGKLILDKTSLRISTTVEAIEASSIWKKTSTTTYGSFRKHTMVRVWSEKETDLFYEIVSRTGPDFGLMHEFFPTRSRNELKNKYNREERSNWGRLKEVLAKPFVLDDRLQDYSERKIKEIEEEEKQKKEEREKRKKKNKENQAEEGDVEKVDKNDEANGTERTIKKPKTKKRDITDSVRKLLEQSQTSPEKKKAVSKLPGYVSTLPAVAPPHRRILQNLKENNIETTLT